MVSRGSLIVLEGCDKAGKSTHVKLLVEALQKIGKHVAMLSFPDRSTTIGQMINKYLTGQTELPDETIHLLFSANRWELKPKIESMLKNGESVVLDRYAFSGVAFSSAKGLDLNWCKGPDIGLPRPDIVIFLNLGGQDAAKREDYGRERYETVDFQSKVKERFFDLKDETWQIIDSDRPIPEVHGDILNHALSTISSCEEGKPIKKLWETTNHNGAE